MSKKEHIDKRIEETLASLDTASRAEVKPFLLTRINARMNREVESVWEKAGWFIGRPAIAFSGVCMIIIINLAVVLLNRPANPATASEQAVQSPTDEFSYTVATIYDTENTQP